MKTESFITVFTRPRHCYLSSARSILSIPFHPITLRSILILSSYICLSPPSGLFPPGFSTNTVHAFIPSPMHAAYPTHLFLLEFIVLITFGQENKLRSSSLCSFLKPPVTSSVFGPNILFSTLFSNIFGLCSFLYIRDQNKP
jgi:hypothetical protein